MDIYKCASHITRVWEFFLEKATLLTPVFDNSDVSATIHCRHDMVNGFNTVFKHLKQIKVSCNNSASKVITVSSPYAEDDAINSTLSIDRNSFCDVAFSDDITCTSVIVSKHDFAVGIHLSSILSQRLEIKIIGPGSPMIIRAEMPNSATLQMALATFDESEETEELPNDSFSTQHDKTAIDEPEMTEPVLDRFTAKRVSVNRYPTWDT